MTKKLIYLKPDSMEATIDQFMKEYRAKNVENMAIIWTTNDDKVFSYNFMATESCFKLLGLLELLESRVLDFIEHEQARLGLEGGA